MNVTEEEVPKPPTPPPAFEFLTAEQMMAPIEGVDWVVQGLGICPGRPAIAVGIGDRGKTTFSMLLAACKATGTRFLGQFYCEAAPVVWLDYEMGNRASRRKLRRLCKGHGIAWAISPDAPTGRPAPSTEVTMSIDISSREATATEWQTRIDRCRHPALKRALQNRGLGVVVDGVRLIPPGGLQVGEGLMSRSTEFRGNAVIVSHLQRAVDQGARPTTAPSTNTNNVPIPMNTNNVPMPAETRDELEASVIATLGWNQVPSMCRQLTALARGPREQAADDGASAWADFRRGQRAAAGDDAAKFDRWLADSEAAK